MRTLKTIAWILVAMGTASSGVFAQGTAFNYQGRLNQSAGAATGIYDLRFFVYVSPVAPGPVGGPVIISAVPITNGLFSVTLDLGAGIFTGPPRWLEVGVRTNGAASFTTLEPRQQITPVPYATHAATASNVVGSVVKSLNNLRDDVTLAAGANVTITPSGNTLTIASATGGVGETNSLWSRNGANAHYNAGNVGIGTPVPPARLSVFSPTAASGDNTAVFYAPAIGPDASHIHYGTAGDWFVRSASRSGKVVLQDYGGNVGIGTQQPGTKLTVFTPWLNYGVEHSDGNVRLATYIDATAGWLGTVSNHKLNFYVNNGPSSVSIGTQGYVGVGTPDPQTKLHLYHGPDSVSHRIETGGGVNAWSRTEYANINGMWITGTSRSFNGDQFYIYRVGAPGIAFGIQPNGDAYLQGTMNCKVLAITGGADLAEPFKMSSEEIPKGAVVVIDEDNPGQLKLSTETYDTRVAGVVSGANGVRPGISLQQEGALEGGENVALSGRVYVQADAAHGAIKPGDLLTTSDTPGHAMKVCDHARAQGAVLGKAMTGLKQGKGLVLVLVTLQ